MAGGGGATAPALPALDGLARTSAFLADARVTIVDARGDVVVEADSGDGGHELVLVWPQNARRLDDTALGADEVEPGGAIGPNVAIEPEVAAAALRIRRFSGAWEHRFDFIGDVPHSELVGGVPHPELGVVGTLHGLAAEHGGPGERRVELHALPATAGAAVRIEALDVGDGWTEAPRSTSREIVQPGPSIDGVHAIGTARFTLGGGLGPIRVAVPIGGADAPLGYVRLAGGQAARENALATTRRAFALAALVASVLAAGLGLVLGHGMSARLRDLASATGRMSGGDLGARAEVKGRDEIGELAARFNAMADSLQTSFTALGEERDALRRFMADASHELRTPITALRSFNELLSGAALDDPAARAEFVAESAAQIDRLAWITGQLLDLSRLDAGLIEIERDSIDVGELLETAAAPHRPVAATAGVTIDIRPPEPPLHVVGDRTRLELALSNLVDNALKHGASRGGRVVIDAVPAQGAGVRIRVSDDGPGVPPEERERIFERFERGSGARSAGTPGSGLGLAIVRSIARAHGGDATVEPTDADRAGSVGSRFVIAIGST